VEKHENESLEGFWDGGRGIKMPTKTQKRLLWRTKSSREK